MSFPVSLRALGVCAVCLSKLFGSAIVWRQPKKWLLASLTVSCMAVAAPVSQKVSCEDSGHSRSGKVSLGAQAKKVLFDEFERQEGWLKVHAAEALLAVGEFEHVLRGFRDEERLAAKYAGEYGSWEGNVRVGLWRVLAKAVPTDREREIYIDRIKAVFQDIENPARLHAVETLGKLGVKPEGALAESARVYVAEASPLDALYGHWLLALSDNASQRDESLRALALGLDSDNPLERLRAAYVVRHLEGDDSYLLAALERAATNEPADALSVAYVTGAAFVRLPAPGGREASAWRGRLEILLANGGPANARYEASQCLLVEPVLVRANAALFEQLLRANHTDTRIGAAWALIAMSLHENE